MEEAINVIHTGGEKKEASKKRNEKNVKNKSESTLGKLQELPNLPPDEGKPILKVAYRTPRQCRQLELYG